MGKWNDKIETCKPSQVKRPTDDWVERFGERMLISNPREIDLVVRQIPKGRLMTLSTLRKQLASSYDCDFTCPMTTGIFLRIVAEASEERGKDVSPYWRVIKDDGALNPKYPGGMKGQAQYLRKEGFSILKKSDKKWLVKDFEINLL